MKSMLKKKVLVTGAGTGIGSGIALAFAKQGADVALHYSQSFEDAEAIVSRIAVAGGRAKAFMADFSRGEVLPRFAREVVAFLGGVDVLVNNAGITLNRPIEKATIEQFDLLYSVNVRAPYFLTQALLPELLASRGAVVNLSSIHAFEGCTEHSIYAGTRGAIVAFTRQLAIELAPRGVRVNAIAPGAVPVQNHARAIPGKSLEQMALDAGKEIPCGFAGTPDDIANVAVFLASDASRYIVGQTLIVDGGTTSWMPFGEQFKKPMPGQFGVGYVPGI
jgi:NAD(P)-dependent dehydrogenase (short-subunit alcohol dehydrogenase family)